MALEARGDYAQAANDDVEDAENLDVLFHQKRPAVVFLCGKRSTTIPSKMAVAAKPAMTTGS